MKLSINHLPLKPIIICSKDDPGLTLTYFKPRSNLDIYVVVWERVKIVNFLLTLAKGLLLAFVTAPCPLSVIGQASVHQQCPKNLLLQNLYTKLHRNDPWVGPFQNCSKNWIPHRTMVAMATERKNLKICLSKTTRCRALIFGMWHHLVLYEDWSNYASGVKKGPAQGVPSFT